MKTSEMNESAQAEAALTDAIKQAMDAGSVPEQVQERLDRTYANLSKIPQERPDRRSGRRLGKGVAALAIAAACALFAGAAFAVSNLVSMGQGDAAFFAADKNLRVYDSMEPGARALSANVGLGGTVDGMEVTLDSISCDRSVANLYLTLHKDGGFNMDSLATYEGSAEGTWAKLQNAVPHLEYQLSGNDGSSTTGSVRSLDAYLEGEDIKCLMRITPALLMPEQVQVNLNAWSDDQEATIPLLSIGLELGCVPAPHNADAQMIAFDTEQGEQRLDLVRFTVSELACVMVTQPHPVTWRDADGHMVEGLEEGYMDPSMIMVTDENGSVLTAVDAGDGLGTSADEPCIMEFAGRAEGVDAVVLTPVIQDDAAMEADRLARAAAVGAGETLDDAFSVDVSQAGTKIPLTDLGGYEIADWRVEGSTVSISMKPYGWVLLGGAPELIPDTDVTALNEAWTDAETGQSGKGSHSAIRYLKWDYVTGEVVQMDSYYAATQEELSAVTEYHTYIYPAGWFQADEPAAQTLTLSE